MWKRILELYVEHFIKKKKKSYTWTWEMFVVEFHGEEHKACKNTGYLIYERNAGSPFLSPKR